MNAIYTVTVIKTTPGTNEPVQLYTQSVEHLDMQKLAALVNEPAPKKRHRGPDRSKRATKAATPTML